MQKEFEESERERWHNNIIIKSKRSLCWSILGYWSSLLWAAACCLCASVTTASESHKRDLATRRSDARALHMTIREQRLDMVTIKLWARQSNTSLF